MQLQSFHPRIERFDFIASMITCMLAHQSWYSKRLKNSWVAKDSFTWKQSVYVPHLMLACWSQIFHVSGSPWILPVSGSMPTWRSCLNPVGFPIFIGGAPGLKFLLRLNKLFIPSNNAAILSRSWWEYRTTEPVWHTAKMSSKLSSGMWTKIK